MEARPIVTAGFKCAPLNAPTAYTATATPNAHPAVMTIHPLFWPLVLLSTTLATTPSPRMTNSMVPSSSARKGGIGVEWEAAKLPAGQRLVYALWSRPEYLVGSGQRSRALAGVRDVSEPIPREETQPHTNLRCGAAFSLPGDRVIGESRAHKHDKRHCASLISCV